MPNNGNEVKRLLVSSQKSEATDSFKIITMAEYEKTPKSLRSDCCFSCTRYSLNPMLSLVKCSPFSLQHCYHSGNIHAQTIGSGRSHNFLTGFHSLLRSSSFLTLSNLVTLCRVDVPLMALFHGPAFCAVRQSWSDDSLVHFRLQQEGHLLVAEHPATFLQLRQQHRERKTFLHL